MKKLIILLTLFSLVFAQSALEYQSEYSDPVHAKIRAIREQNASEQQRITDTIINARVDNSDEVLLASTEGIEIPESVESFDPFFHFPPKHQGLTSSCWAHTGISFIESEVERIQDKQIKLSVMQIVYYDYLEKALDYILKRGENDLRRGSEINGVFRVAEKYGLIPEANYPGNPTEGGFDNGPLHDELKAYLTYCKDHAYWDEKVALPAITAILNKHLGTMPESFTYSGKSYTPKSFLRKVLKFDPESYTALQSTLRYPFYAYTEFPFPDNWWHGKEYYNLPLEQFYSMVVTAVKKGFSVPIGGDTSEPGYNRYDGIAFVPYADIPPQLVDQDAREYRIANETTGDDHAVHIVGYLNLNGVDWFLIKDSSRTAYQSDHPGYYYYRGDYIKLKMLNAIVPKYFIED